jgi:enterochelin esterase-like enzyme
MDNIVAFTPGTTAPSVLMALDGQMYPTMETPEQIDQLMVEANRKKK